jgi:hypothetical protein
VGLVVALVAALALPAAASAAGFAPLTEKSARPFALKLARQVAVKRKARSWNLSDAVSVRSNRVVFIYSDRNSQEVFCTAKLVVEQSSSTRHAFLSARTCKGVPTEALEMEKATSALIRAVQGQREDVRRSVRGLEKDVEKCEGLVLPRSRHEARDLLYEGGDILAVFDPLLIHLDAFVTRLQDIQPDDPKLLAGVVWWRRLVTVIEALPSQGLRPCRAVLEWSRTNYSDETAPVDFAALKSSIDAGGRAVRGVMRAAERLAALGVAPRIAAGFTVDGLSLVATELIRSGTTPRATP